MQPLYVRQLQLGPMKNFVYLVGAKDSPEVAVVDPAWDVEAIARAVEEDGKRLAAAFVTHGHHDHINGLPDLLRRFDVPVYAQKAEADYSEQLREQASDALRPISPGQAFQVGALKATAVHTPGHTPGSQCLWADESLATGDTLFVNACGRCDFAGGDPAVMFDTLYRVLGALPDETKVYPGHDYGDVPVSSLGRERAQNPYFQFKDVGEFVAYRMRPRTS